MEKRLHLVFEIVMDRHPLLPHRGIMTAALRRAGHSMINGQWRHATTGAKCQTGSANTLPELVSTSMRVAMSILQ
ncbi:MAG: hypothetical protein VR78_14325 [Hoeflea sp. BRH_c9]|nr:MAG: hypothetical protein VR78_14325 [Hoeflea sp. BRH_c9]